MIQTTFIFAIQHKSICAFPSKEFYDGKLKTDDSVLNRPDYKLLESFWPKGNGYPIMFVDVEGQESQVKSTKIGVDSTYYNVKEAKLLVRHLLCRLKIYS